jgi:hypothetical protein
MDGLEWKRMKYSAKVQKFLQWAESLAVKKSDSLISDSIGIQNYLQNKYSASSTYIPYGSHAVTLYHESVCDEYGVTAYKYDMLIARLEPENSIEIILDGVVQSRAERKFLVIGKHETVYGEYLKNKFRKVKNIVFVGGIYDIGKLDSLRCFSNLYFHGHTVGGTNPSLLEAMGSRAFICANNNEFNSTILGDDALYFITSNEVATVLDTTKKTNHTNFLDNNIEKINNLYSWDKIIGDYEMLFLTISKPHRIFT